MSNRMYIDGVLIVLIMALLYLIAPIQMIGYAVFVAYGFMGLVSRLFNPMSMARIGAEIGFLGTLIMATPDSMWEMSMYFIASYIAFAYIGAVLNTYYVARRMKKEDLE